jgi:hypothetical protein
MWLDHEFGSDWRITIAHSGLPLPDDDSLTLVSAGLAPSCVLRLESLDSSGIATFEESLPVVPGILDVIESGREDDVINQRDGRTFWWKWLNAFMWLFNPWPSVDEVEDFFVVK